VRFASDNLAKSSVFAEWNLSSAADLAISFLGRPTTTYNFASKTQYVIASLFLDRSLLENSSLAACVIRAVSRGP
jgi:hypothetical protein